MEQESKRDEEKQSIWYETEREKYNPDEEAKRTQRH